MADTSIHPHQNVDLDPEIRAALRVVSGDKPAREGSIAQLRLLWQRRRFLFRGVICGVVAATLVAFLIPPRFKSTVRLMPPDNRSSSGLALAAASLTGRAGAGSNSLLGDIGSGLLGLRNSSELFAGILRSRTVEDHLIAQLNLKHVYRHGRIEDASSDLEDNTEITVDRSSQILMIRVTDKDRYRAAAMAGMYIDELDRTVAEVSTSSARRERIFLEGRLKEVKKDMESAEKDFSQYASKNTAIDIKEQGRAMVEAAATLQGQLIAAQSQLEEMRQIYTNNNVRVRALQARIAELRAQLDKIGGKGEGSPAAAGQGNDSLYPSIRKLPLLGVAYADLYRRVKVQEAIFETLTQEYELARVEEAKEIPTVKVLDAADVPDKKSFPPRLQIVFLGTVLGLAAAATWVLGNQKWQETDASDPRKVFAQEVFSTVAARVPRLHSVNGGFWSWVRRRKDDPKGESKTGVDFGVSSKSKRG